MFWRIFGGPVKHVTFCKARLRILMRMILIPHLLKRICVILQRFLMRKDLTFWHFPALCWLSFFTRCFSFSSMAYWVSNTSAMGFWLARPSKTPLLALWRDTFSPQLILRLSMSKSPVIWQSQLSQRLEKLKGIFLVLLWFDCCCKKVSRVP